MIAVCTLSHRHHRILAKGRRQEREPGLHRPRTDTCNLSKRFRDSPIKDQKKAGHSGITPFRPRQPGKHRQKKGRAKESRPVILKVSLLRKGSGWKTTTDSAEALEILKQSLSFEMNEQENKAARQLFETLKRTNIRIKQTLYKLLVRVDRKELPTFCAKASVFFDSLTATVKDTGCLTSMLKH